MSFIASTMLKLGSIHVMEVGFSTDMYLHTDPRACHTGQSHRGGCRLDCLGTEHMCVCISLLHRQWAHVHIDLKICVKLVGIAKNAPCFSQAFASAAPPGQPGAAQL